MLWIRILFAVTGAYDLILGAAFLVAAPALFETAGVPAPLHWGYVHFICCLLIIFGLMFFAVAAQPAANRNLIPFGILLKLSYVAVVTYYWAQQDVPYMFKPFVAIDAVMLVLFAIAYRQLTRPLPPPSQTVIT